MVQLNFCKKSIKLSMKISLIVFDIMKTYDLKPHQKELAKQISKLNKNNLYYLVSQPDESKMNHTINELKKHIGLISSVTPVPSCWERPWRKCQYIRICI